MTISPVAYRPSRNTTVLPVKHSPERKAQRMVTIIWCLLVLNSLTYFPGGVIHIPSIIGKAITQGALFVALPLALSLNRRIVIRPNVFLCLVSLLIIGTLITSLDPEYWGTIYRTFRLICFIGTLWLLTPWWGRRDLLLVRSHLIALSVVIGSVLLGVLVAPGRALDGRLSGVIWVIPTTEVAHYTAVAFGLASVLWLCRKWPGKPTLVVVLITGTMLLLTHTRTALVAMIAGIIVSGMSLIVATARARKLFAVLGAITAVAVLTLSTVITNWLARGEGTTQLTDLTGRTLVWSALVSYPRNKFQEIFGFGLSNSSFNGLPIDSNWLASYQEQGLFGVGVCIAILAFLLISAYFHTRGLQRALALFLVTYCLIASFTEVGFTDASPYLLELTLAASLIVNSPASVNALVTAEQS